MQALSHAGCLCGRLCQQTLVPKKHTTYLYLFTWTFKRNGFYFKTAVIFHFKTKQGRKWNKHFFFGPCVCDFSLCFQGMTFPSYSRKSSWWRNASTTILWPTLGATSGKSQHKMLLRSHFTLTVCFLFFLTLTASRVHNICGIHM